MTPVGTLALHLSAVGGRIVKNQFFADKHDYFKYDLWLEVAEKLEGIKSLTLIPMLTPGDSTKKGRKVSYAEGKRRKRLYGFLQFCLAPQRRSITRLREFLCDERFEYHAYRDEDDKGFQDGSWDAYFSAVPREWLCDAAILIDPDIGLEPKRPSQEPEHVTYKDIENVVGRCSGNSVVLVIQFLPKIAHLREKQLNEKSRKLQEQTSSLQPDRGPVSWIAEKTNHELGELAFFAIGVGSETSKRLDKVLRKYAKTHGLAGPVRAAQEIVPR
jgi:hypothetical protein